MSRMIHVSTVNCNSLRMWSLCVSRIKAWHPLSKSDLCVSRINVWHPSILALCSSQQSLILSDKQKNSIMISVNQTNRNNQIETFEQFALQPFYSRWWRKVTKKFSWNVLVKYIIILFCKQEQRILEAWKGSVLFWF